MNIHEKQFKKRTFTMLSANIFHFEYHAALACVNTNLVVSKKWVFTFVTGMMVALLQCNSVTSSEDVLTFSNLLSNVYVTN